MLWDYRLAKQAFKNLKKFPDKERERISAVLDIPFIERKQSD